MEHLLVVGEPLERVPFFFNKRAWSQRRLDGLIVLEVV